MPKLDLICRVIACVLFLIAATARFWSGTQPQPYYYPGYMFLSAGLFFLALSFVV